MLNQLAFISGDLVTDLIIEATLALFFFFMFREGLATYRANKALKNIINLKALSKSNLLSISSIDKNVLVWVTDHLIYKVADNGLEIETKDGLWLSKSPISQLLPALDMNRHKLVPALLTSIGITGTFLGITIGLSQFSMAGDSKALLASAAELLEGMKTAFYTSLAGLSTSAIFMALMKYTSSNVAKAQQKFLQKVSEQYFEASPVFYLKSMSNEGQQEVIDAQLRSADAMSSMGASFEASINSLGKLGESFNGEKMAAQISASLSESLDSTMTPMMDSIRQELATLKDIKEQSQRELVELLVAQMRDQLIEPISQELAKTSEAVANSNDVSAQLNANVERVITSTSETVATINEFQKETMIKLQDFAESLKGILGSFKEDTQGAMTTIASEVNAMLLNASEGMDSQRQAFEQSAIKASSAFEGMKESLESALDSRQQAEQQMFSQITGRIDTLLGQISSAFEEQSSVIKQTGESAAELLRQTQNDFEASLQMRRDEESALFEGMQSRIGSLVEESQAVFREQSTAIKQSGESASELLRQTQVDFEASVQLRRDEESALFEGMQSRITHLIDESQVIFKEQSAAIKQTGDSATDLLRQAQTDFENSVQQRRNEESALFSQMQTRIGELVDSSQTIFKEQADAIKQIGIDATDVMASAKSELQQGLGDIDTKVKSMSDTVQRELEAFRIQYQQNLTAYFEQQNNLLEDSLSKQRNGLNEVVEKFRNVFESEYQARHTLLQELTAQYQKLEASAATLERVAKAIGLNDAAKMAELQDTAHTMGREIAHLKKEYAAASKAFVDITENLPKAMDDYFSRANESFETFFNDFDESASKIHNKLSQAAGYLVNAQVQRREFEANEVSA